MHLRRPTTIERTTVDLQARLIIDAEYGAPDTAIRRVQLTIPPGARVSISIDTPTPAEAGPGRVYKFVQLPTDCMVKFWLQPSQAVYAVAVPGEVGMAELGYICEFFDEEHMP